MFPSAALSIPELIQSRVKNIFNMDELLLDELLSSISKNPII